MSYYAGTVARTRRGYPVEITTILPPGSELNSGDAVIGIVVYPSGARDLCTWRRDGMFNPKVGPSGLDLEMPEVAAKAREVAHV